MIEKIVPGFRTSIEKPLTPSIIPRERKIANANPHRTWPFADIFLDGSIDEQHLVLCSDITTEFITREILPCGRPHVGLMHIALINDAIATSSFEVVTAETYGTKYRYVELGAIAGNHREAFVRGSVTAPPSGTIEVDGYRVRWQFMPQKSWQTITQRGIVQIGIFGLIESEEVQVASVEIEYFRRRGVLNVA